MRILVGITCIAVLSAVGYYFWKEYGEHQAAMAAAQAVADRQFCIGEAKRSLADLRNKTAIGACMQRGIITDRDMQTLMKGGTIY